MKVRRKKVNNMSIYLSKKDLKNLAESLNAKKLCNNIYYYENIVHIMMKINNLILLNLCVYIEVRL